MRVCVVFQTADSLPGLEERVFEFTRQLEDSCDCIDTCTVFAEGPVAVGADMLAWSARVSVTLFGEEVKVLGLGSMDSSSEALSLALQDALQKSLLQLKGIAQTHCACGCKHAGQPSRQYVASHTPLMRRTG